MFLSQYLRQDQKEKYLKNPVKKSLKGNPKQYFLNF